VKGRLGQRSQPSTTKAERGQNMNSTKAYDKELYRIAAGEAHNAKRDIWDARRASKKRRGAERHDDRPSRRWNDSKAN
jgi:hypothetical protein